MKEISILEDPLWWSAFCEKIPERYRGKVCLASSVQSMLTWRFVSVFVGRQNVLVGSNGT